MDFASRLDIAMKAAGFRDQTQLATAANIPQPTVNKILSGRTKNVSAEYAHRLAIACKVSLDWLITGEISDTNHPAVINSLLFLREYKLVDLFRQCDEEGKVMIELSAIAALKLQSR